jgi:predicted MFS family arabinose efflux permease
MALQTARLVKRLRRRASWAPMFVIAMGQIVLVFNITALQVSIEGVIASFGTSASKVKTAIVVYALVVAALIMLGARLRERFGARQVFRATLAVFAVAMAMMAFCRGPMTLVFAQALAGAASAAMVPTLVVLVVAHYSGEQRGRAMGWLAAAQAIGIVPALLLAGILAEWIGWRYSFALIMFVAIGTYLFSGVLQPDAPIPRTKIDILGLTLASLAILLVGFGCNNIAYWGPWQATPGAPFSVFGLSPAPILIVAGALMMKAFLVWSSHVQRAGGAPLIALDVFSSSGERSVLFSIFLVGVIAAAITYVIPLYTEVVQGRSTLYTAAAAIPFALSSFIAAIAVVPLRARVHPVRIARVAFVCVAFGAALLAATIHNDWHDLAVIVAMISAGAGEGALRTLLFKMLAARKRATDVGPLCGTTDYLAVGVGTSVASALVIGVLAGSVRHELADNPLISRELISQVDLDRASFISNDRLRSRLARTIVNEQQMAEAVRINTNARLRALKACFYVLAGLALLALVPSGLLPGRERAA